MKRKIIGLCVCAFLLTGLVACGKKEVDNTSSNMEVESTSGVGIVEDDNENTIDDDLKLFKEFYSKFYDEHRDFVDDKGNVMDCFSKIIINDNKAVMAIVDVIEDGKLFDLYLFGTDGKEVVEKARQRDVNTDYIYYDMNIISIDDNLFVICVGEGLEAHIYKVYENNFIEIYNNKNTEKDFDRYHIDKEFNTGLGKNGTGGSVLLYNHYADVSYYDWLLFNDDYSINGTDFETLLDDMMNKEIKDNADVVFCYLDYMGKKYNSNAENAFVLYWKDGIYFELYRDGSAKVSSIDAGYENTEIPEKIIGYAVDKNGWMSKKERELIEKDMSNCEEFGCAVNVSLADELTWNIMKNKDILFEIKAGVTPLTNAITINGISEEKDRLKLIESIVDNLNSVDNQISVKQDMDGSGIIQESFYIMVDKTGKTTGYISEAGKTIEEIKNDKEGDGIYRIFPDLCNEYK